MNRIHEKISTICIAFTVIMAIYSLMYFFSSGDFNIVLQDLVIIILFVVLDDLITQAHDFKSWKSYYLTEVVILIPINLIFGYLFHWYKINNLQSIFRSLLIGIIILSSSMFFYYSKNKLVAKDINEKINENQKEENKK
ncbi:hypothetical protein [Anaeromicropila herbilytica]|uniref:DUF3021 domain-containing protein n=1 Tax=Anaeromicropila herbilytica TaxID=2785025 RepID=A0A7R7ID42_9FIRM|nr:hypothetical protein [Anaeromicropila herbilytica]BCN30634.1 hypothetical protein bsdtb5_19290 [Anaeromicropila herbilytica]